VAATNPFPSSVTSRVAHLTVNRDLVGPTVTHVVGTPNQISLTFSEPLDPASVLAVTNYGLSGMLLVTNVVQDTDNPARVTLRTTGQSLGASYTLTINGLRDRFNNLITPNTQVSFVSKIVIDGSFDDWATVPLALPDRQDTTESTDY